MARPRFKNLDRATRRRILETAAEEFGARGFEGASLNQLIDRLEISKGSFYYYFDDKADLFTTVVDRAWAIFLPDGIPDLESFNSDNYWPALEALMREARVRIRENPWLIGFSRLLYDPPEIPGVRETVAEKFDEARKWQADLIRRGQDLATVRADLPAELLQAMLIGADEAADRWLFAHWEQLDDAEAERICSEMFAIFRRMLESPPA